MKLFHIAYTLANKYLCIFLFALELENQVGKNRSEFLRYVILLFVIAKCNRIPKWRKPKWNMALYTNLQKMLSAAFVAKV